MKHKIMMGKGKEYSRIAREAELNYKNWLLASEINEESFLKHVDGENFYLTFWEDEEEAIIILHHAAGEIAQPLIWQKESGIDLKTYKMDASLLLAYVRDKCINNNSKQKIKEFIRNELLKK